MKRILFTICFLILALTSCNNKPGYSEDELVSESYSPDGTIKLSVYEGPSEDAVMVDFYTVGEIEFCEKTFFNKEMIYYQYHEEYEESYWKTDEIIVINGNEIDITDETTWINNNQ